MVDELLISNDLLHLSVKDFFIRLLICFGIGFVIGLEREHSAMRDHESSFAGVRTFTIISVAGFFSLFLASIVGIWFYFITFIGIVGMVLVSYFVQSQKGHVGSTTEFTIFLVFFLGSATLLGYQQLSLIITIIVMALLSLKLEIKAITGMITQEEIYAFLKFTIVAILILPFLPDKTIDPYEVVNPREVGWVIVLTSGLSFVGYILIKFLGARQGIILTGILGGLVSSTVITWLFSKQSQKEPALSKNYSAAIIFASTIMIGRVIFFVYVFNFSLLKNLLVPLLIILAAGLAYGFLLYRKQGGSFEKEGMELDNPLNLIDAFKFGLLFVGILFFVHFAREFFGSKGILVASVFSALTDVDAITISLSKLSAKDGIITIAQNGILLAVLSNTLVKIMISLWFGTQQLKQKVLMGYGLIFLAGIVAFVVLNFV